MITAAIAIVLVLGALIFFHELGHFVVARLLGMGVSTFSLGFGPKLLKKTLGKTEYCLSAVPLGGYVALVGEEEGDELPEGFTEAESFTARPPWQRLLVAAAGPVANFVLALVVCWGLAWSQGQEYLLPEIGTLEEGGPAARAGVQAGDMLVAIDGKAIHEWGDLSHAIASGKGAPLRLEVARGGRSHVLEMTPVATTRKNIFGEDVHTWRIGVRASGKSAHVPLGFWEAASAGASRTWAMIELTWTGFVKLAQRVVPLDQVGGPIMIAQLVGEQAATGLVNVLALTALISVNLAILNLLPIPVLDGGAILFCMLEMLIRRPVPARARDVALRVGVALLVGLMLLATYNDLARLFTGWSANG